MTLTLGQSYLVIYRWGFYGRLPSRKGISVEITRRPPLFSERNGFRKVFRVGPFKIERLRP